MSSSYLNEGLVSASPCNASWTSVLPSVMKCFADMLTLQCIRTTVRLELAGSEVELSYRVRVLEFHSDPVCLAWHHARGAPHTEYPGVQHSVCVNTSDQPDFSGLQASSLALGLPFPSFSGSSPNFFPFFLRQVQSSLGLGRVKTRRPKWVMAMQGLGK